MLTIYHYFVIIALPFGRFAKASGLPDKVLRVLGILTLDTHFPRIPGDLGAPETFPFPVRIVAVKGADVEGVVHRGDRALLDRFVVAARGLVASGCVGIATTCGFLVRWQQELAHGAGVPVLTSALLHVPLLAQCMGAGQRVGVVTYSAPDLDAATLAAAGADPATPVEGVAVDGYFARTIRHGATALDRGLMAADVIAAARRLHARHPELGALVLECANMPPYRDALADSIGLPVFDAAQATAWFHSGLPGATPRYGRSDLW